MLDANQFIHADHGTRRIKGFPLDKQTLLPANIHSTAGQAVTFVPLFKYVNGVKGETWRKLKTGKYGGDAEVESSCRVFSIAAETGPVQFIKVVVNDQHMTAVINGI